MTNRVTGLLCSTKKKHTILSARSLEDDVIAAITLFQDYCAKVIPADSGLSESDKTGFYKANQ
jgi:hypothetical protein